MARSLAAVLAAAILAASALGCGGKLPPVDPPNLAEAKDSLSRGNYWFGRGCYREAGRFFRDGEISARLSDDVRLIIRALNSRGAASLAAGDLDRAANFLAQALDLAQAQPGRPELDSVLGNLAALALRLGRSRDAEDLWLAAAEAAGRAGASPATYQASLARLHLAAGRRDEFLALADQALAEARQAAPKPSAAAWTAPARRPGTAEGSGSAPDDQPPADQPPAGPPGPENLVLADALNLAGQAAGLRGDGDGAEKFFREALDLDRRMEFAPGLAQDTEALGNLLSERSGEAAGLLNRAFYLRLALGDEKGAARILAALKKLAGTPGMPVSLEVYQAALRNTAAYRLDQRCP